MAIADGDYNGINSHSISVVGDSAGGGLAAAVALKWRQTGRRRLRSQVLIYPMLQTLTFDFKSYIEESHLTSGDSRFADYSSYYRWGNTKLSAELMSKSPTLLPSEIWGQVQRRLLGEDVGIDEPPAEKYPHAGNLLSEVMSPLLTRNVSGVAPAMLILAGFDELRTEGELYDRKLKAAGVPVSLAKYEFEVHAFQAGGKLSDAHSPFYHRLIHRPSADDSFRKIAGFLRQFM